MAKFKPNQLYERAKKFALDCANLGAALPRTVPNTVYFRQLVRSSSSVASNYLESQEALGTKDFNYQLKVCRKEAKESRFWLDLLSELNPNDIKIFKLHQEADELVKIFSKAVKTAESH